MARTVEAIVEPRLLTWARDSAGFDTESAARRVRVKRERLESWEKGEARPTLRQLRELGRVYKRPIAVFYLPEPPDDFQPLRDFRRLPDVILPAGSPALRFEVRRAQDRRELALELFEIREEAPPTLPLSATLSDDQEGLAHAIREFLGIRYGDQIHWTAGYEAFNQWRTRFAPRRSGTNRSTAAFVCASWPIWT